MYDFKSIKTIHLEVTSKCNASCPMCLRNVLGGKLNPLLPITELSLIDIQHILPNRVVSQLERLYLCGNYGDPIMARETLEVLKYLRTQNSNIQLEMFTNGSARNTDWWKELALTATQVRFSVDGIGDINSIYRRGTKWDLIYKNMQAFLNAGGIAEWDFIVFKHNEHQVQQAQALAKDLGFKKINIKKTARFFSNVRVEVKSAQEVHSQNGEIEYYLEQPNDPKYRNKALQKEDEIIAQFGSLKNFFAQTDIDCKVINEKSIYISAEGLVFPCCWTANQLYPWYYGKRATPIWRMIERLPEGLDSLNAKKHPIESILNGPFFKKDLPNSWNIKGFENGRLFVCGKTCGKGFDAFKAQFQDAPFQEKSLQN